MKKLQYIKPDVRILQIRTEQMIALSTPSPESMNPEKNEDLW